MCIGGGPSYPQPQRPEFDDSPPVVTGSQTGVDNPKDTKRATEELKIRRKKKEGTYVDPNLAAVEEKLSKSSNKRVIRRVDGKLTSMSRNKYRSTLRSKAKKSSSSSSDGGRKGGRV